MHAKKKQSGAHLPDLCLPDSDKPDDFKPGSRDRPIPGRVKMDVATNTPKNTSEMDFPIQFNPI